MLGEAVRRFPHTLVAGLVVFALQCVHGSAQAFLYDAVQYWGAPMALLTGGGVSDVGVLQIRGVLSVFVYLAPALVTTILGPASAVWTVLAWNALLASVICVVLVPRVAALVSPGRTVARIWLSAVIGGAMLSGFARYPHLDVWSAAFALTGVYCLAAGRRWWTIALGGAALAVAANLRPSYIAPLAIAAVVLLVARPRQVVWALPGIVAGVLPQVIFNLVKFGSWNAGPVATPFLLQVQAQQAAFTIRYDTVAFVDRHPQQWFCDPAYAALLVDDAPPTSPSGVMGSALAHLPDSLWFLSQKAATALHWSLATPYEYSPSSGTSVMTLLVVAVSAVGLVALVWRLITVWSERPQRVAALALLGFWFGALATLVLSTPETRFALPLALVGLIGLLTVLPLRLEGARARRSSAIALGVAVILVAALFVAGKAGLSHPQPPGALTDAAMCAAMSEDAAD